MNAASSEQELKDLFSTDEAITYAVDTGYRSPLHSLSRRPALIKALKDYYGLIKYLLEIEQFLEGLEVLGVASMIKEYPQLMRELFVKTEKKIINRGMKGYLGA